MQPRVDLESRTCGRPWSGERQGAARGLGRARGTVLAVLAASAAVASSAAFAGHASGLELAALTPSAPGAALAAVPTVTFAIAGSSAGEGTGQALVEVRMSAATTTVVSIPITVGGTATQGADYALLANPVLIPVGVISATIRVDLVADALFEGAQETLVLGLGPPTGATLGAVVQHTLLIVDDDPLPVVSFASHRSTASEAAGGFTIRLALNVPSGRDAVVPLVLSGPASGPSDLTLATNPVTLPAGQLHVDFPVVLVVDDIGEAGETVTFELGAGIVDAVPGAITSHLVVIDDGNTGPGTPMPPALVVTPPTVVFPQTTVESSAGVRNVQISNPYTAPIAFLGLAPTAGTVAGFHVRYPGFTLPALLAPGQALTVEVEFLPVTPGPRAATFVVQQGLGGIPPSHARFEGIALGDPGEEVVINCGDVPYISPERVFWSSDFGVVSSEGYYASYGEVLGTEDDVLYHQSRWGQSVVYRFNLPNGLYELGFLSWEPVASAVGARVFDVTVEGQLLFDDVDVFAAVGARRAWVSPTRQFQVSDGTVDIRFDASVARALVSALAVRSVPIVGTSTPVLDFGTVDQGSFGQLDLVLTNTGLAPGRVTSLNIFPGGSGPANEFAVELGGNLLVGGPNASNFALDLPVPVGQLVRIPVLFTPTQHRENELSLRLNLASGDSVVVDVVGTGGANAGWGFMHPVILIDPQLVIDYDSSGSEPVQLSGGTSHTHEPGAFLSAFEWRVNGQVVGTAAAAQPTLPLGQSSVELTIADGNSHYPPTHATAQKPVAVHPVNAVPGILARYYDGSVVGEVALLDNVPAVPDYVARQAQLQTLQVGTSVGTSPFIGDVMVRWTADFQVPVPLTLSFVAQGGTAHRVIVDGQILGGPVALASGAHTLDVRFAVDGTASLPLELDVFVNGALFPTFGSRLTHAEGALRPIIHSMPTSGIELGGNDIVIEGFGYFPRSQVVVNWGATSITQAQFVSFSAERIQFVSPPGIGSIPVTVTTPNGTSNARSFQYSASGPVPIRWTVLYQKAVDVVGPTRVALGPDGRLWVALIDGSLRAIHYDDQWNATVQYYPGVFGRTNKDVLGLTFDPFDVYDPLNPASLVVYIGHGEHYQNGGTTPTSPSPFTGEVSRLTGPNFDHPVPVVTGLPTSNHDHSINGIEFDDNGDLLIAVGGNTNAGVPLEPMGDIPESPQSAAILKAFTSRSGFDGTVRLLDRLSLQVIDDQRYGEAAIVAPTCQVEVFAPGLRNAFDFVLHSNGYIYATDNGPNVGYGPASTGLTTQGAPGGPYHPDEILLIERGNYYGHPNRARGIDDPRQLVYHNDLAPPIPHGFTQQIAPVVSSTNGIEEYRAAAFGGQLRGHLVVMPLGSAMRFYALEPDGRTVVDPQGTPVNVPDDGLDIALAPGGAIVTCNYYAGQVRVQIPDDLAAIGLTPYDVFPARGPNVPGVHFELGGSGFGSVATTSVLFNGVSAVLTSVTPRRIQGIVPSQPASVVGPVDVTVNSAAQRVTLTGAYRYLPAQRGFAGGFWKQSSPLPFALGEVASAELHGRLYVFGRGDARTLSFDALNGTWQTNLAQRPFAGSRHAAEAVGERLYLLGGVDAGSPGRVQIYDPPTDSWSIGAPMPWAGDAVATAVIGGRIYAAGGLVGTSTVSNFAAYDPATNAWTSLGALPVGVHHASAGTDGARFYLFGGRQGGAAPQAGLQHVQVYDPVTATWSTSQAAQVAQLPLPRSGAGRAVWYRDRFFIFGGENSSSTFADVLAYEPATNSWRRDTSLPTARQGHSPVRFEDRVFVLGGGVVPGTSGSAVAEVFKRP